MPTEVAEAPRGCCHPATPKAPAPARPAGGFFWEGDDVSPWVRSARAGPPREVPRGNTCGCPSHLPLLLPGSRGGSGQGSLTTSGPTWPAVGLPAAPVARGFWCRRAPGRAPRSRGNLASGWGSAHGSGGRPPARAGLRRPLLGGDRVALKSPGLGAGRGAAGWNRGVRLEKQGSPPSGLRPRNRPTERSGPGPPHSCRGTKRARCATATLVRASDSFHPVPPFSLRSGP